MMNLDLHPLGFPGHIPVLTLAYNAKETLQGKPSGHVLFYWHGICVP